MALVSLIGEHDIATSRAIAHAFGEAAQAVEGVIVDLTRTEFIDTSVVHALVVARRRAIGDGGRFVTVIGDNEVVRQVLELIGLEATFETAASVDEAVSAIGGG